MEKLYLFTDVGSDTITMQYPQIMNKDRHYRETGSEMTWSFQAGLGQNMYRGIRLNPVEVFRRYGLFFLPIEKQFIFVELLKILLGGIFFFLFLRQLKISIRAATMGGMSIAFSGYMIVGSSWYAHSSLVWQFCFLLLCFEGLLQRKWFAWLIPLSVFWVGLSPQLYLWLSFLISYGLFRLISTDTFSVSKVLGTSFRMIIFSVLGLMLNGPGLVSQYSRYLDNPRLLGANAWKTLGNANLFELETPLHYQTILSRLLGNDLLGTANQFKGWNNYLEAPLFYVGILAVLCLPLFFYFLSKRERWSFGALFFFWWAVSLIPILRYSFYLFSGDFFKTGLSIFIPVLLSYAFARCMHSIEKGFQLSAVPVVIGAVLLVLALLAPDLGGYGNSVEQFPRNVLLIFTAAFAVLLIINKWESARPIAQFLLILLLGIELAFTASYSLQHREPIASDRFDQRLAYNDYTLDALEAIRLKDGDFFRVEKFYSSCPKANVSFNDGRAQNFYGTSSYASFNQPHYLAYMLGTDVISGGKKNQLKWVSGLRNHSFLQAGTAVKYHLKKSVDVKANEEVFIKEGNISVLKFPYYQSLGLTYTHYIKRSIFDKLSTEQKARTLLKAVVIDDKKIGEFRHLKPFTKRALPELKERHWNAYYKNDQPLDIFEYSNQVIKGKLSLDEPRTLILSMPYARGWKVRVNGEKVDSKIVQLGFLGINLEAGDQLVELNFRPPFYFWGILSTILAFVLYGMALFISVLRKKKLD